MGWRGHKKKKNYVGALATKKKEKKKTAFTMCLFYKVAKGYFKVSVSYVILIFETVLCDRQ